MQYGFYARKEGGQMQMHVQDADTREKKKRQGRSMEPKHFFPVYDIPPSHCPQKPNPTPKTP